MTRTYTEELQTRREICRAEFLVALAQGLTRDQSVEALRYRAAAEGLSVHAAALAVLTPEPTDEVLVARSSRAVQSPSRGHLYALSSPAELGATDTRTASAPRGGRHRR
jgi:hypothetical protein